MNRRHAAALALVGWYLMVPRYDLDGHVLDRAPLSSWKIFNRYDSLRQCEEARQQISQSGREFIEDEEKRAEWNGKALAQAAVAVSARCISATDPRLRSPRTNRGNSKNRPAPNSKPSGSHP